MIYPGCMRTIGLIGDMSRASSAEVAAALDQG